MSTEYEPSEQKLPVQNSSIIILNKGAPTPNPPDPSPQPKPNPKPSSIVHDSFSSLPIWAQWFIKVLVFICSFMTITCGIFLCKAKNKYLLNTMIAGVILILSGFSVILFEGPILCQCSFSKQLRLFSLSRPVCQKLILYTLPSLIVLSLSHNIIAIYGVLFMLVIVMLYAYFYIIIPKIFSGRTRR